MDEEDWDALEADIDATFKIIKDNDKEIENMIGSLDEED